MGQALFVIGPAGSGKTTFCKNLFEFGNSINRHFKIINLDPANVDETFSYYADIRDHITVDDVQENTDLGPNGGLILALQEMVDNIEEMELNTFNEDFLLFDCPGQIELYVHSEIINDIVNYINKYLKTTMVYLMDAFYLIDPYKYVHGYLTAYISTFKFNVPRLNVVTKIDLLGGKEIDFEVVNEEVKEKLIKEKDFYGELALKIYYFLEENENISFMTIDWNDEESIINLISSFDMLTEYWEDTETKIKYEEGSQ